MLHVSANRPATIAEVIEFLQKLPSDTVCTRRCIEVEASAISVTTLDTPPATGRSRVWRVELTLEPGPAAV